MTASRQLVYWSLGFALLCLLLYLLRGMLLPFVAGMAVAYFLDPAVDRLERWGLSRTLATSIITAAFLMVIVALLLLMLPILQKQVLDFVERVPQYTALLKQNMLGLIEALKDRLPPDDMANLREAATKYVGEALTWVGRLLAGIWSGGMALASLLSLIFITPIVAFYLLRDWDRLLARIDAWLPRQHAETVREQMRLIDQRLAGFVRGQALVCVILGLFYGIALTIAGLQFGLIVGLGAGAVSFIPYVGTILGLLTSVGLAVVQFSEWQPIAVVAGIFVFGQVVEGNFLSPKLVGDRIGLHPLWIIFALFAGGTLLGFVGVLLAVPAAAVIGVLGRFAMERYMESPLYAGPEDADGPDPQAPEPEE